MAGTQPNTVDTPDYQVGVTSAQALLATVAAATISVVVGVPPNAETLIVMQPQTTAVTGCTCTGVTSGLQYTGMRADRGNSTSTATTWFFDVSSAVDQQVTIVWNIAPVGTWYVYSDAGVHLVADPSRLMDTNGSQYVVPIAPSTRTGNHPPTEVQAIAFNNVPSGTVLLAAPGAGKRYRIFSASCSVQTAGQLLGLRDSVSGTFFYSAGGGADAIAQPFSYGPSGLPLSVNAAVTLITSAGVGQYTIAYTTESI